MDTDFLAKTKRRGAENAEKRKGTHKIRGRGREATRCHQKLIFLGNGFQPRMDIRLHLISARQADGHGFLTQRRKEAKDTNGKGFFNRREHKERKERINFLTTKHTKLDTDGHPTSPTAPLQSDPPSSDFGATSAEWEEAPHPGPLPHSSDEREEGEEFCGTFTQGSRSTPTLG